MPSPPTPVPTYSWILPSGERYVPYSNLHCVVRSGREAGQLAAGP